MIVEFPEGNRKKFKNFVRVFTNQVVEIAQSECLWIATFLRVKLIQRLWRQDFNHKPLSASYVAYKKRKKLDDRILIATHAYIDSIQVDENRALSGRNKGEVVGYVVRPRVGIHPPSGLPYIAIARIHEFGSRKAHIPARPHWRPVWQEFMKGGGGLYVRRIHDGLRKKRR